MITYTIEHPTRGVFVEKFFSVAALMFRWQWSKPRTQGQHFATAKAAVDMTAQFPPPVAARCYLVEWNGQHLARERLPLDPLLKPATPCSPQSA